tara:strand:+ start:344 stop:562 length:219 start_codon:yes stop_codon:yes gene_type:complete
MKKILITPNGVKELELTTEEIAQKETDEANAKVELQKLKDAEEEKETKKASGKQKLKDLGLDDDEIKALMGA